MFDMNSGITLQQGVSASGVVPGVWSLVRFLGKDWIDGGMISSTNAFLAEGHKRVVVISPMPRKYGLVKSVQEDVADLKKNSALALLIPDEQSVVAIGKN